MSPGGTMEDARKESLLEKVRKLLVQAGEDSGATEAERAAFEQRANALMAKYAIEEAEIWANQTKEERERPVAREMQLFRFDGWYTKYHNIIIYLEDVCRVKVVTLGGQIGKYYVAGYDADVRFFEMLWTSIHLAWISKLRPEWKPGIEHEDENVYNFVTAGYKWREIAEAGGFDWPDGGKLKRAYNRHCKKIGVSPTSHTQRHGAYRDSFAEGFANRISMRLWDLANSNTNEAKANAPGTEVALRDRHQDVLEMVYEQFPRLRHMTDEELRELRRRQDEEEQQKIQAYRAWYNSLTPAQQRKEDEKQLRQQERAERDYERWRRQQDARKDARGSAAGRAAADSVDLTGGRGNIGGAEREALS